jgi:hypothetical protein
MIVFGGVQTDNELSNEVWALSLSNLRWRKLNALGIRRRRGSGIRRSTIPYGTG